MNKQKKPKISYRYDTFIEDKNERMENYYFDNNVIYPDENNIFENQVNKQTDALEYMIYINDCFSMEKIIKSSPKNSKIVFVRYVLTKNFKTKTDETKATEVLFEMAIN